MEQLLLFNAPKIKTKDLEKWAVQSPSFCYAELIKRGVQKPIAIWFFVERNFKTEFVTGCDFLFLQIKINKTLIKCYEKDMKDFVEINQIRKLKRYEVQETDNLDKKYTNKIKSKLKEFILNNAFQFDF